MPEGLRSKLFPIVCAAMGAGGALVFSVLTAPPAQPAPEIDETAGAPTSTDAERLAALERRVSALGRRSGASDATPTDPAAAPSDPAEDADFVEPAIDPEQARERGREERTALLERHESERVDAGWAPRVESALGEDFSQIAKRARRDGDDVALDVLDVDCRSRMCKIRVEWGSYDEAIENAETVAMHAFAENCPVWVFVPEPESASSEGRYQHEVLLDCSESG